MSPITWNIMGSPYLENVPSIPAPTPRNLNYSPQKRVGVHLCLLSLNGLR